MHQFVCLQSRGVRTGAGNCRLWGRQHHTTYESCVYVWTLCTCIALRLSAPAPTPNISEAVETRPSLIPITAARSQGAPVVARFQVQRSSSGRERQGAEQVVCVCLPACLCHGEYPPCQAEVRHPAEGPSRGLHAWILSRQQLAHMRC
jgi:hypothetical protein